MLRDLLRQTIDGDRYPLSPLLRAIKAILAKIDPPKPRRPLPPLKPRGTPSTVPRKKCHYPVYVECAACGNDEMILAINLKQALRAPVPRVRRKGRGVVSIRWACVASCGCPARGFADS